MSMTRRRFVESCAIGTAMATMASSCVRIDQARATDLAELDAVETASRIRSGEISAEEAVEAAINRAWRLDESLNAIATKTFGRAREAVKNGAGGGPFAGVPSFVKDLDDVVGVPTGFGSRAFPFYRGNEQTPLTDAFLGLGVVSLGKSTTPEFGLSATTEPIATGPTRNPWDTNRSAGGSSGGAAALVASGVVPIAHASDGGGSIRIPASCCGNVGLKVSRGRNPPARPEAGAISISVHGVQSRTVRDTAVAAAAMALPAETSGLKPLDLVTGPSDRRLRIALLTEGVKDRPIDPVVVEETKQTAMLCAELGHDVSPISPPFDPSLEDDFTLYWAAYADSVVSAWDDVFPVPPNGFAFEPFTLGLSEFYRANVGIFDEAVERLQSTPAVFDALFEDYDLVLSPVVAAPPPPIGRLGGRRDYATLRERLLTYVQFTALYNITGAPAISLPLSMSPDGLPIGAMFGAGMGDETTLLELAFELEEAAPWADRRPRLFG
ncbi:MAG: amidase [Pseudomonadota bacterium]